MHTHTQRGCILEDVRIKIDSCTISALARQNTLRVALASFSLGASSKVASMSHKSNRSNVKVFTHLNGN